MYSKLHVKLKLHNCNLVFDNISSSCWVEGLKLFPINMNQTFLMSEIFVTFFKKSFPFPIVDDF